MSLHASFRHAEISEPKTPFPQIWLLDLTKLGIAEDASLEEVARIISEASAKERALDQASQPLAGEAGGFIIANFCEASERDDHRWVGPFPPSKFWWAQSVAVPEGMHQLLWKPEGGAPQDCARIAELSKEGMQWGELDRAIQLAEERRALSNASHVPGLRAGAPKRI